MYEDEVHLGTYYYNKYLYLKLYSITVLSSSGVSRITLSEI